MNQIADDFTCMQIFFFCVNLESNLFGGNLESSPTAVRVRSSTVKVAAHQQRRAGGDLCGSRCAGSVTAANLDGEGFPGSNVDGDGWVGHDFVTAATSPSNSSFCSSGSPRVGRVQR